MCSPISDGGLPEEGQEQEEDREDRQHIHDGGEDHELLRQTRVRGLGRNERACGHQLRRVLLRHLGAAQRLAGGVMARLRQLRGLGLGYLTLDRATPTLSAGELQRLRLATQLSSLLFGVVYVLDEPSAGLHPSDSQALYDALDRLRDAGNSVFVVEHDLELMRRAQWLVDVGPDAGERGGRVLYSGEPDGLRKIAESRTARYLFDEIPAPGSRAREAIGWLELQGVHRHNLHGVDARIPLGVLTAVTGISGSGKSSLVAQALPELVLLHLGHEPEDDVAESATS